MKVLDDVLRDLELRNSFLEFQVNELKEELAAAKEKLEELYEA